MPTITFDWTINVGTILSVLGIGGALIKWALAMRDAFTKLEAAIGDKHEGTGLLGAVAVLNETTAEHRKELRTLRDGLIQLGAETGVSLRMNRT